MECVNDTKMKLLKERYDISNWKMTKLNEKVYGFRENVCEFKQEMTEEWNGFEEQFTNIRKCKWQET